MLIKGARSRRRQDDRNYPAVVAGSGTVTLLFTDLVGSTESLVALGEDRYDSVRDEHEVLVAGTIAAHQGEIVKSTGDGYMGAFRRAGDAVGAAAEIQRLVSSRNEGSEVALGVRIGISAGDVVERAGDYQGVSAVEAARLCAAAAGGQILVSETVRSLVGSRGGHDFVALGDLDLKGLPPLSTAAVRWCDDAPVIAPAGGVRGNLPASPAAPFARAEDELAGRRVELDRLENAWTRARDGVRQVALVAGEPGIGKTRLAAELSSRVPSEDGVVLYGRCDVEGIVPYQPFVEALRPSVAAYSAATLHQRLHGLEQDLARVFPELPGRLPEQSQSIPSDAESERYRLFEAIAALVTGITATRSAILVLDDLHWADKPTVLLFRHIVRSVQSAALLIVVCYREMELATEHPLADLVADLRREPFVAWIGLDGLSEAESRALLEAQAGVEIASSLNAVLHDETGGNPLFLEELLRHLTETERLPLDDADGAQPIDITALDLPDGVRDVVARRLRRLPNPVNDVLSLAAVIGMEFDAALIGRAAQERTEIVLEALDEATDARLVREHPDRTGRYVFSHALIRQTVYKQLRTARRAQLHASIGAAMEDGGGPDARAGALAHHFTEALPLGTAAKAIEYTTKAGYEAVGDFALEDAVTYFERALHLLEEYAPTDWTQRVELLIDLAAALVNVDDTAGVHAALRAVDAARANGSPEQFGRAVAVFAEPNPAVLLYPNQVGTLLDEAQQELGDDHPSVRARLVAIEAFKSSTYQLQGRDGRALADRAVQLARGAADAPTLTAALFARAITLESTAETTERLALGEELVALGRAARRRAPMATAQGLRVLAGVHLELGDAESLTSTIAELGHKGEELRWVPALVFEAQWRATQALLEGRFEEVRTRWNDMRRYARAYRAVADLEAAQTYYLAREQGDLAALLGPLEQIAAESSESLYVPALVAVAQLDTADETAALRTLDALTAQDLRRSGTETAGRAVLALLAEVAAAGEAKSHAALLYKLLDPFAGRLLATVIGLACLGAADRYQGMLSTTLERWDAAETHFERALDLELRVRGHALVPRTQYWQARFLRARAGPGDDLTARAILGGVVEDTRRLGMRRLCEQAEQLLAR
jgi:class 3 adenylate cyclase